MKYLVDTNVLSEAHRAKGHPTVRAKLVAIDETDLFLSVITIGEIARGIAKLAPGKRRSHLAAWLAMTERHFSDRILPVSTSVARLWGEITVTAQKAGRVLGAADGLIAATAIQHGLRLLTRNFTDVLATSVVVVNPLD